MNPGFCSPSTPRCVSGEKQHPTQGAELLTPLQAPRQPAGLLCIPQPLPAPELAVGMKGRNVGRTESLARPAEPSTGRGRTWAERCGEELSPSCRAWCGAGMETTLQNLCAPLQLQDKVLAQGAACARSKLSPGESIMGSRFLLRWLEVTRSSSRAGVQVCDETRGSVGCPQ